MKLRYTLLAGIFALAGLASCEMKEELLNKGEESTEVGYLDLGLAVDASSQSITKSGEATPTTPTVSATGFDVEIFKKNEETAYKTFTYDGAMEPVELPVGDYTVYAHSAGKTDNEKYKSEPFYGKEEPFTVEANETQGVTIVCTMMNTKIQLTYDQELDDVFKSWDISVTDGTNVKELEFNSETGKMRQPDPFYWFIAENVSTIKVTFTGHKEDGTEITESRSIFKSSTAGSQYWEAADALNVTIKPGAEDPADPSGVTGIEITANLTWNTDGKTDNITVPIEDTSDTDDTEKPDDGDNDGEEEAAAPTLEGEYLISGINYDKKDGGVFPNVEVFMDVPGKIEKVMVQADSDNTDFKEALAYFSLTAEPEGTDLVTSQSLEPVINPLPEKGATSYKFSLGALSAQLVNFEGEHSFKLKVYDQTGQTAEGILKITITDSSVTE